MTNSNLFYVDIMDIIFKEVEEDGKSLKTGKINEKSTLATGIANFDKSCPFQAIFQTLPEKKSSKLTIIQQRMLNIPKEGQLIRIRALWIFPIFQAIYHTLSQKERSNRKHSQVEKAKSPKSRKAELILNPNNTEVFSRFVSSKIHRGYKVIKQMLV